MVQETDLEAIVSATAYVDLFLRKITAPPLLALWVKFIFSGSVDKKDIVETLINRINSSSQVNGMDKPKSYLPSTNSELSDLYRYFVPL